MEMGSKFDGDAAAEFGRRCRLMQSLLAASSSCGLKRTSSSARKQSKVATSPGLTRNCRPRFENEQAGCKRLRLDSQTHKQPSPMRPHCDVANRCGVGCELVVSRYLLGRNGVEMKRLQFDRAGE